MLAWLQTIRRKSKEKKSEMIFLIFQMIDFSIRELESGLQLLSNCIHEVVSMSFKAKDELCTLVIVFKYLHIEIMCIFLFKSSNYEFCLDIYVVPYNLSKCFIAFNYV